MRVLQIGKYYPPHRGGIERVLGILCGQIRDRCDLRVLCFNDRPESVTEVVEGVLVSRMARWESVASVPIAPGMYFWLRERSFDVVNLHVPNPLAELIYLLTRPAGKLVVSYHAEPQKAAGLMRLYSPVAKRILQAADVITAASPHHFAEGTTLSSYREKCRVIPYGIDLTPFEPPVAIPGEAAPPEAAVTRWREQLGDPFVLFVARLVPYKGLIPLMEAVRESGLRLAIVGSGPLYANLQQLRAGMEDRVSLLGNVPDEDLPALFRAARCFVLPSLDDSEAFGMVQIESFAAGTPVVASDLPTGVSWVNQHEVSGLLVPPGDVVALRQALQRLCEDEALADRLGQGARARARELFRAESFGDATFELYRKLWEDGERE